jgi:hypothetical protein
MRRETPLPGDEGRGMYLVSPLLGSDRAGL